MRIIDIKIGEQTAVEGWKGKTWCAAKKLQTADRFTNSPEEKCRLAGAKNLAIARDSRDPTNFQSVCKVLLKTVTRGKTSCKTYANSKLSVSEILGDFIDMHKVQTGKKVQNQTGASPGKPCTHVEYAELVLHEAAQKLAELSMCCRQNDLPPQQWIGSSVALAFDVGTDDTGETNPLHRATWGPSEKVQVKIFDWGRSELEPDQPTDADKRRKEERERFWKQYKAGIDRLSWEAARAYFHRFGNDKGWTKLTFQVWDFQSFSDDTELGRLEVNLEKTPRKTVSLENGSNISITYKIDWLPFGDSSRLKGSWRVELFEAKGLAAKKNPFVTLVASRIETDKAGKDHATFQFWQVTRVIQETVSDTHTWEERFDIPVAKVAEDGRRYAPDFLVRIMDTNQDDPGFFFPASPLAVRSKVGTDNAADEKSVLVYWSNKMDKAMAAPQ